MANPEPQKRARGKFAKRNRWDIQIVFPGFVTYGLQHIPEKEATYGTALGALEDFLKDMKKVRRYYEKQLRKRAASSPQKEQAE